MKAKFVRCGVCLQFHHADMHCRNCGAYRVVNLTIGGVVKVRWVNYKNVPMERGLPIPYEKLVNVTQ